MIINSKNKNLTIHLGDAVADNELIWNIDFIDTIIPLSLEGLTTGVTPATMVAGIPIAQKPPQNANRKVTAISVYNADTEAANVVISLFNESIERTILSILLEVGYTLHYGLASGWYVTNEFGSITTTNVSVTGLQIGETVIDGVHNEYLYVDNTGTLQQGWWYQDANGVKIANGKNISSADNLSRLVLGNSGTFAWSSDNGVYTDAYFGMDTHSATFLLNNGALGLQVDKASDSAQLITGQANLFMGGSGIAAGTNQIAMDSSMGYLEHGTKLSFNSPNIQLSVDGDTLADSCLSIVSGHVVLQGGASSYMVLNTGMIGNSITLVSDSIYSQAAIDNVMSGSSGVIQITSSLITIPPNNQITLTTTEIYFKHTAQLTFVAPAYHFSNATASTVPYFDASKNLVSSGVTPTQLSYLDATSSIQTQLNGKEPAIAASTTAKYWRGDKTFQTLDTSVVPENGNLYFTTARTLATALAGLSITGSSISSSDTILQAFGKVQNQINGLLGGAIYKGVYNATTNTPTLVDGTGTAGYYYVVNVGGNQNFGSGTINFNIGDWVIYNGTIWQKVDNTDAVSDVNGAIGSVSLVGTTNRITVTGTTWDISAAYVGQTSITTLSTVTTGTWNATKVSELYGGTNQSAYTTGDTLFASATNTLSKRAIGTSGDLYIVNGGVPTWQTMSGDATISNTGAVTLKTVNSTVGTFGSATLIPVVTVNAKGLITNIVTFTNQPNESDVQFTDITTNNSSTTKHGYLKKLSNVATQYMDGTGAWSVPIGTTYTASNGVALAAGNFTFDNAYFSGDVTTSAGVTAIGANKVLNAMINSVAWGKITGTPTTLSGYGITDAYTKTQSDANYLLIGGGTLTGNLILNADPSTGLGAATKQYVDAALVGLQIKQTAMVATNAALPTYVYLLGVITITATGTLTVDSYVTVLNDYVLVHSETGGNAPYNGLYKVTTAGAVGVQAVLTRATDMNTSGEFSGALVPVGNLGTVNANSLWLCNPVGTVTVGTTPIPFTQLNGATDLVAGAGITISGNTISIGAGAITNTMLAGSIAYSKLSLTGAIVNADLAGSIAYSKLSLSNSVLYSDFASMTSANLLSKISDATGTGFNVFATSPTLTTPILGVAAATSISITGTGGNGFVKLLSQSSQPTYGASGFVLYSNAANKFAWRNQADTYERSFSATLTADRIYTLQDVSDTLAGITDVYFILPVLTAGFSPADSTTYYAGIGNLLPGTTVGNYSFNIGYKFTIIGAVVTVASNTTAGTSENITAKIRNVTQAASSTIGTFTSNGGSATAIASFTFTGLNIAVAATDTIAMEYATPAWATNPVATRWYNWLMCKRAV